MHEHWNDVPGDIAGEDNLENQPGGFGVDDPDRDIDADLEEHFPERIFHGTDRLTTASQGNDTMAAETEEYNEGATVSYHDLLEEEKGPGAGLIPEGGEETEVETEQQRRNMSVESEGPYGDVKKEK